MLSLALLSPAASSGAPSPSTGAPAVAPAVPTATAAQQGLTLTRVTPVVATPGEPVTIAGLLEVDALGIDLAGGAPQPPSAASPSEPSESEPSGATPPPQEPIATVELRLGGRTPQTHEGVAEWLSSGEPSQGRVLATSEIITAPDTTIDRIPFSVTIGDLRDRMRGAYGILPVSVEVSRPGMLEPVAVLRTFVGYQVRKEYEPLELTWVVPFTVPPDVALVGEFGEERTAAWEALVGEGGALRERLASASDPRVVWALDPALLSGGPALEELEAEASDEPPALPGGTTDSPTTSLPAPTGTGTGTGIGTGTGTEPSRQPVTPSPDETPATPTEPTEPTETPVAPATAERRLRSDFATLLLEEVQDRDILLLPTHDTDVAALPPPTSDGHTTAAVRALVDRGLDVGDAEAMLTDAGAVVIPTVWPAAGGWSVGLDATLRDLSRPGDRPWSVLASTTSIAQAVGGPFPSATGATVLPYDALLSERADTAHDEGGAIPAALAMAADSLILLNERPGTTRNITVALDRGGSAAGMSADLTAVLDG
ncbi:MAG: hypothetical protein ABR616_07345, partial [Dermatophilaceae bacterium]